MNTTNRSQQVNASMIIRERIELVKDEKLKSRLHKQYCDFLMSLNQALD